MFPGAFSAHLRGTVEREAHLVGAELRPEHLLQGEDKRLMQFFADSLKVAAGENNDLLRVRVQPQGNRGQRFLKRETFNVDL